jgi:uncharacterized membrane protein
MALAVFTAWIGLIGNYFNTHDLCMILKNFNLQIIIPILITIVFTLILAFGYCLGDYQTKEKKFLDREEKD